MKIFIIHDASRRHYGDVRAREVPFARTIWCSGEMALLPMSISAAARDTKLIMSAGYRRLKTLVHASA